ncbi:hypothetical protein KIH74_35565 [Kineosporia sp. J2-2]|uniref:Uncharacterized protein n=1 Tax=Kineosporia corallincola TaxID=2835133 RepID=A0ABS5TU29_9ACTN|nr:hypothetical protein [Kineosporia corallincola]MBT0774317.1 hypothetical protein [Kineosporia corallincola]
MVWFSIDDGFSEHPKALGIARTHRLAALGLWTVCGIWSAQQLTDGRLSAALAQEKGGRPALTRALVDAGLWHDHQSTCTHAARHCPGIPAAGGLTFHDWFDWQRSRRQILRERERKSAAGRAGGKASGASRRGTARSRHEAPASRLVQPPVPVPVPHLNPYLLSLVCRRLFDDAAPARQPLEELLRQWQDAAGNADLESELRNFLLHNVDTPLRNPPAALLGWLNLAATRASQPGPKAVLGCADCIAGWLPEHPESGMPVPCPRCKPHRYAQHVDSS